MDTKLEVGELLEKIQKDFYAVILYPRNVTDGEIVRIAVWVPGVLISKISLKQLDALADSHLEHCVDITRSNRDGGLYAVFDVCPRSEQELMESVLELHSIILKTLHINSVPMSLPGMKEIEAFLKAVPVNTSGIGKQNLH